MFKHNVWWGIAGIFLAPLSQIIFHSSSVISISKTSKKNFKLYYLSIILVFLLGILAAVFIPAYYDTNTTIDQTTLSDNKYTEDIEQTSVVLVEPDNKQETEEELLDAHLQEIHIAHPDADTLVSSNDFSYWLQGLKPSYNANYSRIISEGNAKEVIYMLDEFKRYQTQQNYETKVQQQQIEQMKQVADIEMNRFPEKSTNNRKDRQNRTMRVLLEGKAQEKKQTFILQGYSVQEAEKYAEEWKQKEITKNGF